MPFPFAPHIPRQDEPPFEISENEDVTIQSWDAWVLAQPDHTLLVEDADERALWTLLNGSVSRERLLDWHITRERHASRLRAAGQGDILEQYWPNNEELHKKLNVRHIHSRVDIIIDQVAKIKRSPLP